MAIEMKNKIGHICIFIDRRHIDMKGLDYMIYSDNFESFYQRLSL